MARSHAKSMYLSRPDHCPFCGRHGARCLSFYTYCDENSGKEHFNGRQVKLRHEHHMINREILIEHECADCQAVWHDVMKLVDVEVVQDGSLVAKVARNHRDPTIVQRVHKRRGYRYSVRPSKAQRLIVQPRSCRVLKR